MSFSTERNLEYLIPVQGKLGYSLGMNENGSSPKSRREDRERQLRQSGRISTSRSPLSVLKKN